MPEQIQDLLRYMAAVERYSEHPVAHALLACAEREGVEFGRLSASEFDNRPGFGVAALVDGRRVVIGNDAWMELNGVIREPRLKQQGEQLDELGSGSLLCAMDGQELALIGLEDRVRADAPALIQALKGEGMQLILLTGDRWRTAQTIAHRLGGMEVIAEVQPEEKDQVISQLQADGGRVAMVGDGVNDAPALVRADVGIALGSGTDVSIASADIVLISNELEKVRLAAALSRRTLRTIRQNIGLSITYNLIMVPLAMAAFVTPLVAAVSMPVSSLLVIGNAARIRTLFRGQ
jgi:Cu2+-exporting ATPase